MRLSRDPAARRRLAALAAVAGCALAAGLALGAADGGDGDRRTAALAGGPRPAPPLRQPVGQVLLSSFDGARLPDYMSRRLRARETAGVILFGRNVASREGLRELTRALQRAAGGKALVAVDQEGGPIRNVPFAGPAPAQPAQGAPSSVESLHRDAARELRAAGVNVNLAPVADVAASGSALASRAFVGGPQAVTAASRAAVRGMRAGRVAGTPKHFPGLGRATQNTDDAPVTIPASRAQLERSDLAPFRRTGAPLVMASHALYPALDRRRIASQSPVVLRDLLRRRLRYRGVVVTDSIEAEAVLRRSNVAVAAERSLRAGADLVLLTGSGSWRLVFPHLIRRARRDPALRRRIAGSAARVARLKRELGLRGRSR